MLSSVCVLQRIQYSKKESDIIAKMKGTFVERPKKKKAGKTEDIDEPQGKKKKKK
jgi:hypothetical protein